MPKCEGLPAVAGHPKYNGDACPMSKNDNSVDINNQQELYLCKDCRYDHAKADDIVNGTSTAHLLLPSRSRNGNGSNATATDGDDTRLNQPPVKETTESSTQCDILILNELLCFLANRMRKVTKDELANICLTFYSPDEILEAKIILFLRCQCGRMTKRTGVNRNTTNMDDIMKAMFLLSPEVFPTFVAHDISRLAPVNCDSIDMISVLNQVESLRNEVRTLQQVKRDVEIIKAALDVPDITPTNSTSEHTETDTDANLIDRTVLDADVESHVTVIGEPNRPVPAMTDTEPKIVNNASADKPNPNPYTHQPSFAGVVGNSDTEWKLVQRKRKNDGRTREPLVIGTSKPTAKVRATDFSNPNDLHLTKMSQDQTADDFIEHVKVISDIDIKCVQLKTRRSTWTSFKLTVDSRDKDKLLKSDVWPDGCEVYKWNNNKRPNSKRSSESDSKKYRSTQARRPLIHGTDSRHRRSDSRDHRSDSRDRRYAPLNTRRSGVTLRRYVTDRRPDYIGTRPPPRPASSNERRGYEYEDDEYTSRYSRRDDWDGDDRRDHDDEYHEHVDLRDNQHDWWDFDGYNSSS